MPVAGFLKRGGVSDTVVLDEKVGAHGCSARAHAEPPGVIPAPFRNHVGPHPWPSSCSADEACWPAVRSPRRAGIGACKVSRAADKSAYAPASTDWRKESARSDKTIPQP